MRTIKFAFISLVLCILSGYSLARDTELPNVFSSDEDVVYVVKGRSWNRSIDDSEAKYRFWMGLKCLERNEGYCQVMKTFSIRANKKRDEIKYEVIWGPSYPVEKMIIAFSDLENHKYKVAKERSFYEFPIFIATQSCTYSYWCIFLPFLYPVTVAVDLALSPLNYSIWGIDIFVRGNKYKKIKKNLVEFIESGEQGKIVSMETGNFVNPIRDREIFFNYVE